MYLSSKTCLKHLAGDSAAIMRIHAFLEHWGLINFKLNPKFKPNFIPKAFNFKSPVIIDSEIFMYDNSQKQENINANYNNPESPIVLTNKKKCVSTLYPINKISNEIFNKFLDNLSEMAKEIKSNNNSDLYKYMQNINFLSQNYRPKCDICGNFCLVNWYISKENSTGKINQEGENDNESDNDMGVSISIDEKSIKKDFCLICEECFVNKEIPLPKNLERKNFEISTVYNLFSKERIDKKLLEKINEQKWTEEENKQLLENMKTHNNWDDLIKSLGKNNNKTKKDCILHLMQMPVIELKDDDSDKDLNESEKEEEIKNNDINKEEMNNEINKEEKEPKNAEEIKEKEKEIEMVNNQIKIEEEKKEEEKNDKINNNMLEIFMRLFKRYLDEKDKTENVNENGNIQNKSFKEVIYKTFAKSINKCQELKNVEKNEMKNIVDILVYLQMRKIELKMNYFRQFERLL